MGMEVAGDPNFPRDISCVQVLNERKQKFEGPEKIVLTDLMEFIKVHDPDVILLPYADTWVPIIIKKAKRLGLEPTFSRSGFFKSMASKSYWSYGKVNHKDGALIPEGRVLIDTFKSFVYTEGGLKGVLMASRLSGLSPNLTSRFTPGTLISSYEVYEALRRGVAVPFRKRDAAAIRDISELRASGQGRHDLPTRAWRLREGPPDRLHLPLSLYHCEVQPLARDYRTPGEDWISCKRPIITAKPSDRNEEVEEDQ